VVAIMYLNDHCVGCACSEGWLSHAILDVFETEPLPADSELWSHPKVTITPHVSGFGIDVDEVILRAHSSPGSIVFLFSCTNTTLT
jgi:hypothetical protein